MRSSLIRHCRRFFCSELESPLDKYIAFLKTIPQRQVNFEARILGLRYPRESKRQMIADIESNRYRLQKQIKLRWQVVSRTPTLSDVLKQSIPSEDQQRRKISLPKPAVPPKSPVNFPYIDVQGEQSNKAKKLSSEQIDQLERNLGVWIELFTKIGLVYPEEYSTETLNEYLKTHSFKNIYKDLQMFRQRSVFATANSSFLRYWPRQVKANFEVKQTAHRLYTMEREFKASYGSPQMLSWKLAAGTIVERLFRLALTRHRGSIIFRFYTTYTACTTLEAVVSRKFENNIMSLVQLTIIFCMANDAFGQVKEKQTQSILSQLFQKVVAQLSHFTYVHTSEDVSLWAEMLWRLSQSAKNNEQWTEKIGQLVPIFLEALEQASETEPFRVMLSSMKGVSFAINCMCLLHATRVNQILCSVLQTAALKEPISHLPKDTVLHIVKFLYFNKANLSRIDMLRLASNEALYEGDLQELWMFFLLLSKEGVEFLPYLLRLAVNIATQTEQKVVSNDTERRLLMSVLHRVDSTISELTLQSTP